MATKLVEPHSNTKSPERVCYSEHSPLLPEEQAYMSNDVSQDIPTEVEILDIGKGLPSHALNDTWTSSLKFNGGRAEINY